MGEVMNETLRVDIIESCLEIDRTSRKVYGLFSVHAKEPELKEFWRRMSAEETGHQVYWERLLELGKEGKLENVFHNPDRVSMELRELRDQALRIFDESQDPMENAAAFQRACQLEFFMTYPAFEILYRLMSPYTKIESPEVYYERHIDRFLEKAAKYGGGPFDSGLVFQLLSRLWENGKDMARAEEALRSSFEELKLFAYSVAHDVKSPAIGIHGVANLLNSHYKDMWDEKGRKYCDQILRASEQLVSLVDKINLFIATKEVPLAIEEVKLKEILGMIKDEFSVQLNTRNVNWSEPEILPNLKADRLSMMRLFRNLVDNALKYGGEQLSKITIGYVEQEDSHVFSVSDDGVGIGSQKIFEMYQRGEKSKGIAGTGLGLAIVTKIAERHDGKVWVEAGPERGTVFHVSLSKKL
jgi:signal transduction histidine kinase